MNFVTLLAAAIAQLQAEGWTELVDDGLENDCDDFEIEGAVIPTGATYTRYTLSLKAADGQQYGPDVLVYATQDRFRMEADCAWGFDEYRAGTLEVPALSLQDVIGLLREGERRSRESRA